jgi:hypothetical protein
VSHAGPPVEDASAPWKWLGAIALACGLTWYFFEVLWLGGGLIGGDLYPYFFPQKTVYAQALREGTIPLWNPLVGHGYPQHAESQTGSLYPPNLVAYALWDVNDAYVTVQLAHYVIAFLGALALARVFGADWGGGLLAALVYTYGWFPARLCLEWAIIGGAWMPWCIWGLVSWRGSGDTCATRHWRYLFAMWGGLTLQLLAGHFVFAFMTQLVLVAWLVVFFVVDCRNKSRDDVADRRRAFVALGMGGTAIVAAYLAAAAQLVPTWEYKQLSQRGQVAGSFDPGYGHLPWWSLAQVVTPWSWYADPTDINNYRRAGEPLTNRVEAHLYFGLIPLALVAVGASGLVWRSCQARIFQEKPLDDDLHIVVWSALGILALIHATTCVRSLTDGLPGFGYFTGPGRFGAITTLAVAMISGLVWRQLGTRWPARWSTLAGAIVWVVTLLELGWVDSQNRGVVQVLDAPIAVRERSPLRSLLADAPQPVRLFCRGQNVATLLDVASTPTYLGLSPAQYQDPATALPEPFPFDTPPTSAHIDWLRRAGVTHVLSFSQLDRSEIDRRTWPVRQIAVVDDPFLNRVWGRYAGATEQPLFWLYELLETRGRVAIDGGAARVVSHRRERVEVEVEHSSGGRLVLTDLAYPGWRVTVNGQPAPSTTVEGMYRGVDVPAGRHTVVWEYQPASFRIGLAISTATLLVAAALGHVRFWHPRWWPRPRN